MPGGVGRRRKRHLNLPPPGTKVAPVTWSALQLVAAVYRTHTHTHSYTLTQTQTLTQSYTKKDKDHTSGNNFAPYAKTTLSLQWLVTHACLCSRMSRLAFACGLTLGAKGEGVLRIGYALAGRSGQAQIQR